VPVTKFGTENKKTSAVTEHSMGSRNPEDPSIAVEHEG
jgi:hypothetical protein